MMNLVNATVIMDQLLEEVTVKDSIVKKIILNT